MYLHLFREDFIKAALNYTINNKHIAFWGGRESSVWCWLTESYPSYSNIGQENDQHSQKVASDDNTLTSVKGLQKLNSRQM